MRMEELSESRYIKTPDTVEKYLLQLVQAYFESNEEAPESSREYIIQKALDRMKQEFNFDGMGVTSVIINDEERVGAVKITLEDLNGEPVINPKRSAFNVDFGNEQGTACEGNDPRLSDAREPLSHKHSTADIIGLDGIISTLTGKVQRVNGLAHTHSNKDVLDMLIYTGNKKVIDLTLLDTLEDKVSEMVKNIRSDIINYKKDINDKITEIYSQILGIENLIDDLKKFITSENEKYYKQSTDYTDEKYDKLKEEFTKSVSEFIGKDDLDNLLSSASQLTSLAGSFEFYISSVVDIFTSNRTYTGSIKIPDDIINTLSNRGFILSQCQIEFLMKFKNTSGQDMFTSLPYIVISNGIIEGSLQVGNDENNVYVEYSCKSYDIPDEIANASIICNIYSRQDVTL